MANEDDDFEIIDLIRILHEIAEGDEKKNQ
jgi:hypothetical protein